MIADRLRSIQAGDGGWSPPSLPLYAWYESSAALDSSGDLIATDSILVKTWIDKSGNGNNLVQTTTGSQPVWRSGSYGINSVPVLESTGLAEFINTTFNGSSLSVYIVAKRATSPASYSGMFQIGSGAAILHWPDNAWHFRSNNPNINGDITTSVFGEVPLLHSLDFNNTVLNYDANSSTSGSKTSAVPTSLGTGFRVFSGYAGKWSGKIAEVIVCSRPLTSLEKSDLVNYINKKYNLNI